MKMELSVPLDYRKVGIQTKYLPEFLAMDKNGKYSDMTVAYR